MRFRVGSEQSDGNNSTCHYKLTNMVWVCYRPHQLLLWSGALNLEITSEAILADPVRLCPWRGGSTSVVPGVVKGVGMTPVQEMAGQTVNLPYSESEDL